MCKNPIFSVIIPAYNRDDTIVRAINSVLSQTFSDFEIIVVDDGSDDNTVNIIKNISDDRVKLICHEKNMGQIVATNTAIKHAKGKFIAFLDSDDIWLEEMLQMQYAAYSDDDSVQCVYTHSDHIGKDNIRRPVIRSDIEGYIYKDVLEKGYLCNMSVIGAKRECIEKVYPFDTAFTRACRDDEVCFQLAKNFKFRAIKNVLSISNADAKVRINGNRNVPFGWWFLFNKHKNDIIKYCGHACLANHFKVCAERFAKLSSPEGMIMAKKAVVAATACLREMEKITSEKECEGEDCLSNNDS